MPPNLGPGTGSWGPSLGILATCRQGHRSGSAGLPISIPGLGSRTGSGIPGSGLRTEPWGFSMPRHRHAGIGSQTLGSRFAPLVDLDTSCRDRRSRSDRSRSGSLCELDRLAIESKLCFDSIAIAEASPRDPIRSHFVAIADRDRFAIAFASRRQTKAATSSLDRDRFTIAFATRRRRRRRLASARFAYSKRAVLRTRADSSYVLAMMSVPKCLAIG